MSENEENFEALRRLLALKRHEVPPPGYFEDFSGRVLGRIRAAEAVRELPWLLRLLQAFETKPAYPVAFASALCTLLLFGIVSVEQSPVLVSNPVLSNSPDDAFSTGPRSSAIVVNANTNPPVDVQLFGSQPNTSASFQNVDFTSNGN
ncbi:MAG TPA: hypothetical protein VNV43_05300 [Candidatus Acidoferrales bacterium]|jgi:hypothetical protein|nr:hypothetical protein [Candidatus Acidoferrales bacterium]